VDNVPRMKPREDVHKLIPMVSAQNAP